MTQTEIFLDASLLSPVNVLAREDSNPRDWIFTFGSGHRAYSALRGARLEPSEAGKGLRLDDRYVVIHGTFASARQRICEIFGQVWCAQYGTRERAGVDEYNLTELVITE